MGAPFFGIRLMGQGSLSLVSTVTVSQRFLTGRGTALGLHSARRRSHSRRAELAEKPADLIESLRVDREPSPLSSLFALEDAGVDEHAEVVADRRLTSFD